MIELPIKPSGNQAFEITLGGQNCSISLVYHDGRGLFMTLIADGTTIISGRLCVTLAPLIGAAYRGFSGELVFVDTSGGANDPTVDGMGDQFRLLYLTTDEAAGYGF